MATLQVYGLVEEESGMVRDFQLRHQVDEVKANQEKELTNVVKSLLTSSGRRHGKGMLRNPSRLQYIVYNSTVRTMQSYFCHGITGSSF